MAGHYGATNVYAKEKGAGEGEIGKEIYKKYSFGQMAACGHYHNTQPVF